MCNWIAYISGSSFSFALSDSLADSVLGGEDEPNCSFNMSPTQQMLISSAINFLMGLLVLAYQVQFSLTEVSDEGIYAILGGIFSYFSYYFLIMAFDGSSSTVILPLVQVSSIWTLLGSVVQNSLQGTPWLKNYWHLVAYALLLIGGLLPATGGNLQEAMHLSFWKQRFVQYALLSEVCYGT